jgi:hypothetical protein
MHKVKHWFKWGVVHKVRNGKATKFWIYVWLDEVPLKISYCELFVISSDPNALVSEMEEDGRWVVQFRRELTRNQMEMWRSLLDRLRGLTISAHDDILTWALEKHGSFSTRSLYRH